MDNEIDTNRDGIISEEEEKRFNIKASTRRKMAWLSLIAIIATMLSLLFFVPESKIEKLDGLMDLYWIGLSSIVGAFVGIETWMHKK